MEHEASQMSAGQGSSNAFNSLKRILLRAERGEMWWA